MSLSQFSGVVNRQEHGLWESFFLKSAGAVLLLTGIAKVISVFSASKILYHPDPVFGIEYKNLMLAAGVLEIVTGVLCFRFKREKQMLAIVTWIATNFLIYRVGLWWLDLPHPCGCLGTLTDSLHIRQETADNLMKLLFCYLLFGSYGAFLLRWWENRNGRLPTVNTLPPIAGA